MSRREELISAVVSALSDDAKPDGLNVHRFRQRPLVRDQLPALVVYLLSEQSARGDGPFGYKTRRDLVVRVECRVKVEDDTPPDTAIDPLVTWAVQAMLNDPQWCGLAVNTQDVATTWDAEEHDAVYVAAAVDFSIEFLTLATDPGAA